MNDPQLSEQLVFESVENPGDMPPGYVYARSVARPLLWCSLPVMIAAATAVLMERDPLSFVVWGFPLAVLAAISWTVFRLTRRIAKIHVTDGYASVYSIWDAAHGVTPHRGPLLHAERTHLGLRVSIGDTVYRLRRENWPEFERLLETLRRNMQ